MRRVFVFFVLTMLSSALMEAGRYVLHNDNTTENCRQTPQKMLLDGEEKQIIAVECETRSGWQIRRVTDINGNALETTDTPARTTKTQPSIAFVPAKIIYDDAR